jgi:hypothetical protein
VKGVGTQVGQHLLDQCSTTPVIVIHGAASSQKGLPVASA